MTDAPSTTLPAATHPGPVVLTVADLARSIAYYDSALGLKVTARDETRATLGTSTDDLLVLIEEPGARPADGYSGLFHFALLLPTRADLARFLAHAGRERVALTGLSDHFVSEAVYLRDPDHHGIEIYADRPREVWEGQVARRMTSEPLDTASILQELADPAGEPYDGIAEGTVMGHVHLRVAHIPDTVAFYRDVVGLDVMASLGPAAAFLSAGGYHHHLGANTWESPGAGQAPPGSATLQHWTLVVPEQDALDALTERAQQAGHEPVGVEGGVMLHDPSGNAVRAVAAA